MDDNANFVWKLDGVKYPNVSELLTAIEALDGNIAENRYEPGYLPAGFGVDSKHTIGWAWEFYGVKNADADSDGISDQDEIDTEMGNAADLADVTITITITATQID